jgi:hypothetical protein
MAGWRPDSRSGWSRSAFAERATTARTLTCRATETVIANGDRIAVQVMANEIVEREIATIPVAQRQAQHLIEITVIDESLPVYGNQ